MSGWGIAETAPVIEKIKAESADYLRGLNSCGEITWSVYDKAFDFYMELISRAYEQGKKDVQPEIIRCGGCRWFGKIDDRFYRKNTCTNPRVGMKSGENDFCSYAEAGEAGE